ncbi:MAG: 4-hydroxy-tetrahydrodipicolinate reductase [Heliobacteriaceae bacterium]|nr:4-hydroxy-tetrahydrodipicolinate reductase [Heliobacteriaceae bacterium]
MQLVGVVDPWAVGKDAAVLSGLPACGMTVQGDLATAIQESRPEVMVDFTNPAVVRENIRVALQAKVSPVVGTTGLTDNDLLEIDGWAKEDATSCLVAPNFAVGALLMIRFAQEAARFFPHVEIIELHHDQKLDAPSGTALKTAEAISRERKQVRQGHPDEKERFAGVRGGEFAGMRLHSIRLPGLIAHQEVIFGGVGQTLTIRHDSTSRESFMPGVLLAIQRIRSIREGLVYGLEKLIF